MDAKHTAGKWRLERDRSKSLSIYSGKIFIGEVYHEQDEPSVEQDANARLIASAPELLEALKGLIAMYKPEEFKPVNTWKKALEAVAKAEGRA